MKKLLLLFPFFFLTLLGQSNPPSSYPFAVPAPGSPTPTAGIVGVGSPGGPTYYYWVVTHYTQGNAINSPRGVGGIVYNSNTTLSMSNYNKVSWQGQANATGYDILRTLTSTFPNSGSCTNCLVVSNTTNLTVNDTANTHSGYTLTNPVSGVSGSISLNANPYEFVFNPPASNLPSGAGNVTGPVSSTDGDVALFNGTTGKIIKDGGPLPTAGQVILLTVSGSSPTYTATTNVPVTSYTDGLIVYAPDNVFNCDGSTFITLNINSIGAVPLYDSDFGYNFNAPLPSTCNHTYETFHGYFPLVYSSNANAFGFIANNDYELIVNNYYSLASYICPSLPSMAGCLPLYPNIFGTTASIGGGPLTASCATGTATVAGATAGQAVAVSPAVDITSGGTTAFSVFAVVTNSTTVTVYVCGTGTPTATTYTVRVIP